MGKGGRHPECFYHKETVSYMAIYWTIVLFRTRMESYFHSENEFLKNLIGLSLDI